MPLLDHFHPPLSERRHWEAFHSRWASALADALNDGGLPDNLFAEPTVSIGGLVEVDVATQDETAGSSGNGARATAVLPASKKATPAPAWSIPAVFPDSFEVKIINSEGGPKLVAAIELVSPSNKDRPETHRAFLVKCASYLYQGIALIIIDVVTSRSGNFHNELMEMMQDAGCRLAAATHLYATAYRPVRCETRDAIDIWPVSLGVGQPLPSLPLYVAADFAMMVDFEAAYLETCKRLRLR